MDYNWKPYVPVAKRREDAKRLAAKLISAGHTLSPITAGRRIATTFWGQAWCQNLERYSDFANRLSRGRTYLRNGFVIDLRIEPGSVIARVMGSSLYDIKLTIKAVPPQQWQQVAGDCARSIDSLVELLQGRFASAVMERIARPGTGLFPTPTEITFTCSCPDAATLCKHVAATLYGIGARLDQEPELLFHLRGVDAKELIAKAGEATPPARKAVSSNRILDASKLTDVFGIDLAQPETLVPQGPTRKQPTPKTTPSKRMRNARRKV